MSKKYKFRSTGNLTIGLRSSYKDVVRNHFGDPISTKTVPPVRAVFNNGYFETDDKNVVDLLLETPNWGNDIFWDPTSIPEEHKEDKGIKEKAKIIAKADVARKMRRKKAQDAAKEGSVAKEQ